MSIVIPTLDLSTVASTSTPSSPTSSIFSVSTVSRRRRKKKGGKLKAKKECTECEKRRKAKISVAVCPYHRFRHTIINSSHENLRQVFIEICYDREFNTFNIVQFVARMLKPKGGLRAKGKIFVEDLCRFAMMGVRGKKLGNSYVAPETITTYLKNARLPFSLYKRHLHKGHFSLCIAKKA
jgi:hypothetical protein